MELTTKGYSTRSVVKVSVGNTRLPRSRDYQEIYDKHISKNEDRNQIILSRARFYTSRGVTPILVVCKLHNHLDNLYLLFSKAFKGLKVAKVHHETPNRVKIIEDFRAGKIDILLATLIITRGQNLPHIKVILYAAGGDSPGVPLQVHGRGSRTHESKSKFYFEDFYDMGDYLERHSKHRISYYKAEGFKLINLAKSSAINIKPKKTRKNAQKRTK